MSDLKHTELRHKLLAAVAAGKVCQFYEMWEWADRSDVHMVRRDATGLTGLRNQNLLEVTLVTSDRSPWRSVATTDAGSTLLSEWDTQYGKVTA